MFRLQPIPYTLARCIDEFEDELFTFDYPLKGTVYAPIFELQFLKRFKNRPIGQETWGEFKDTLESMLLDLTPKLLQQLESNEVKYNPFVNTEIYTHAFSKGKGKSKQYASSQGKNSGTSHSSSSNIGNEGNGVVSSSGGGSLATDTGVNKAYSANESKDGSLNRFQDTPQQSASGGGGAGEGDYAVGGAANKILEDGLLTKAEANHSSHLDKSTSVNSTFDKVATEKYEESVSNAKKYSENISENANLNKSINYADSEVRDSKINTNLVRGREVGLRGVLPSDVLKSWQSTFRNFNAELLDELESLFYGIY